MPAPSNAHQIRTGARTIGHDLLKAVVDANATTIFYKDRPGWNAVRRDERFQALLRRMRVPVD
jgi:hypothetical protein